MVDIANRIDSTSKLIITGCTIENKRRTCIEFYTAFFNTTQNTIDNTSITTIVIIFVRNYGYIRTTITISVRTSLTILS